MPEEIHGRAKQEQDCVLKVTYASRSKARKGARRATKRFGCKCQEYRCKVCPGWHVTSHWEV